MRINKAGQRSMKLHDPVAIEMVESIATAKNVPLFEAAELLILNCKIESVEPTEKKDIPKIIIDKFRYTDFIDALIRNGYDLTIAHVDSEKLCITFE